MKSLQLRRHRKIAEPCKYCLMRVIIFSLACVFSIFVSHRFGNFVLIPFKLLARHTQNPLVHPFKLDSSHSFTLIPYNLKPHTYREKMIEKITIKFGMELKPTQNSCKSQLYKCEF